MADLEKIKKEILDSLEVKTTEAIESVNKELDLMEITEGINSVNNLESFYDIWQKNKNNKGHKNDINSWTAYYLGMTEAKPNGEFLAERRVFARAGFPDIDSDFDYFKREKVYEYLINKYGREYVGNIGTYGALKLKSVVRRIGKALDIAGAFKKGKKESVTENEAKVSEILATLPKSMGAFLKVKDENGKEQVIKTVEDAYKYCPDFRAYIDKYPDIRKYAKDIEGLFSNFGCVTGDTPILTKNGWVRIDQLDSSIKVAFLDNNKNIKYSKKYNVFKTGNKSCYKMTLSDGSFVKITDEHLVFTDQGVIPFEKIRKEPEKYKISSLKKELTK